MHWLDWCIIALYMLSVMAIGRFFARRQQDTEDYYRGGGRMPWLAVALSVVASLASTVSYLGTPSEVIQHGLGLFVHYLSLPASMLVILLFVVPFYKRAGVTTAFELIGDRYGLWTRLAGVFLWSYMQVAFLGLVLLLASRLITEMTDVPVWIIVVIIGMASVIYTSNGGIQSVIWTDALQFVTLVTGAVITLVIIALETSTGPNDWVSQVLAKTDGLPPVISFDLTERHTLVGTMMFGFVVTLSYACSDQVVVQRYATTKKAVTMMFANYILSICYIGLLVMVGAGLLLYYINVPGALPEGESLSNAQFTDRSFQYFIVNFLPVGVKGLVMAALFGAAQSTLDSGINSLSAVFTNDILPALNIRESKVQGQLKAARWASRVIGVFVILMAIAVDNMPGSNNIVDIAQKVVHLAFGPVGALFIVAMFLPRIGAIAINMALAVGVIAAAFFAFQDVINEKQIISPILIIPSTWLITLTCAVVLGFVFRVIKIHSHTDS